MEKVSTAERLKQLMNERGLRQIDIIKKCLPYCKHYGVRLESNDMSQYVSGRSKPNQIRLTILGLALDVSEVWLMGYDVPMERKASNVNNSIIGNANSNNTITVSEHKEPVQPIVSAIITICNSLSESEQTRVLAFAADILSGRE